MDRTKAIAFLDIGTNSVRLLIMSTTKERSWKILARHKSVVRLGEKEFKEHTLIPDAIERTTAVISRFVEIARSYNVEEIIAVATSASREAENRDEFINRVYDQTGVRIQIITGEEEARLIWLGVSKSVCLELEKALFIDIGGGSTEVIVGDQYEPIYLISLRLGAIRLTTTFFQDDDEGIVPHQSLTAMKNHIDTETFHIIPHLTALSYTRAYGSSGTIIALESIAREHPSLSDNHEPETLTLSELDTIIEFLCSLSQDELRKVPGLNPDRADIIIAGSLILQKILNISGLSKITISRRGLRDGLMEDYLNKKFDPVFSEYQQNRSQAVTQLGATFQIDEKHGHHVMTHAIRLFDSSRDCGLHSLPDSSRELLKHAAYLHDIGQIISFTGHHHHSNYLIANSSLPGFHQDELRIIGLITRYHRKKLPRNKDTPFMHLHKEEQKTIQILAQLLRIAETLDHSHDKRVASARFIRLPSNRISLEINSNRDCSAEWDALLAENACFKKTFNRPLLLTMAVISSTSEKMRFEPFRSTQLINNNQNISALEIRG